MLKRYRQLYACWSRRIHRATMSVAALLWMVMAVTLVVVLYDSSLYIGARDLWPAILLFIAALGAPLIISTTVESALQALLHRRFRRIALRSR